MKMRHMSILCWIPKVTNAHVGYVTFAALPLHQRLHESASVLCYTYFVSLVSLKFKTIVI